MSAEVLVVGSLAYDSIETAETKGDDLLGGSASHFSMAAALAGARPRIVAVVGDDFRSEDLAMLAALPADLDGVEQVGGETFRWSGRYSADFTSRETVYTRLGVFESFRPSLPDAFRRSEILFLANIHPALQLAVLDAVERPRFVGLDSMNLWIETCPDELAAVAARVDLLFLNDEEARLWTGETNLVRAGRALQDLGPGTVLLKKGEHGLLLFSGDDLFPFPAFPVGKVVDPTGAGDSFAGGVMGRLAAGGDIDIDSLKRAVLCGTALGGFAVEGLGVGGLARRDQDDLRNRVDQLRALLQPPAGF